MKSYNGFTKFEKKKRKNTELLVPRATLFVTRRNSGAKIKSAKKFSLSLTALVVKNLGQHFFFSV